MPAQYQDGEFTSCEGDLQDEVGTYTLNGQSESLDFVISWLVVYSYLIDYTSPDLVATRFPGPIHNTPLDTANSCIFQLHDFFLRATLWRHR